MANLVVKTNQLNSAIQNLSLMEIRLVQLAIIDARESGLGLNTENPLTISVKRYAEAFGVQTKNAYANIKEAEETLFNRRFSFIDDDGYPVKSRWVQQVKYLDDKGAIEIVFTTAVVKGISRIDGAVDFFTKYLLSNTINFKSVYSVRLYELMNQWKNADPKKMPLFEIEKFRGQLGISENDYTRMFDFKKYVLDKAVDEINKHSDLTISYKQEKSGRNIIGFKFRIKQKNKQKINKNERDSKTLDMLSPIKMNDKQRYMFAGRLSREYELQEYAVGDLNDYGKLTEWIADDLLKPERTGFYRPLLDRLGFIEHIQ